MGLHKNSGFKIQLLAGLAALAIGGFSTTAQAVDTDGDGVDDNIDLDDDNNGILDVDEGGEEVDISVVDGSAALTGVTPSGITLGGSFGVFGGFFGITPDSITSGGTDRIDNANFTFASNVSALSSTNISFDESVLSRLPLPFNLEFGGSPNVAEVHLHLNSLDQIRVEFTPTTTLGFEVLSSVAASNTGVANLLSFGDDDPGIADTSSAIEAADGFGGGSADGTIRFQSLPGVAAPGCHVQSIPLSLTEQVDGLAASEAWQLAMEVFIDSDGDCLPDRTDLDDDNDGIPDSVEVGAPAPTGLDTDADGIDDAYDPDNGGIVVVAADTDGDGVSDKLDDDSDNDGIPDPVEAGINPAAPTDSDADGIPNFLEVDSDNDGIDDIIEAGPNPATPIDSDGNGIADFLEPSAVNPPVVVPPVVEPTAVNPPAVEPPVVEPTAVNPPAVEPPVVEPPVVENPPVDNPPIGEPPTAVTPPSVQTDSDNDGIPDSVEIGNTPETPLSTDDDPIILTGLQGTAGCTISENGTDTQDPSLPLLAFLAAAGVIVRRRQVIRKT